MTATSIALTAWAGAALVFVAVLWPLSLWRRDASLVDFWWGPGMAVMAVAVWWAAGRPTGLHAAVVAGLVTAWGLRLGTVLSARRLREPAEDPRYQALRATWSPGYWWKSLFVVFVLQAVLQGLVISGALAAILSAPAGFGPLGLIGVVAAAAGLATEAAADRQLDRFRAGVPHGAGPKPLCREGLRALVRFPHYAGEMLFWAGIAALALDAGVWWAPAPALLMAALLIKVSGAPMMDEHLAATRPDYAAWAAATPAFVPRLRALGAAARRSLG